LAATPIAAPPAALTPVAPHPAPGGGPRSPHAGGGAAISLERLAWTDMAVPLAVLGIVLALIVPLPPFAIDLLIGVNITLSVIVLMVSMYIGRPVEFSVFPTTLLLMTLFRLALNVSSARLILLNGNTGTAAAGHVIEAFGTFVVGGSYVIGAVIFLVLIAIQYVVINHGAVRISEVTARFTLDALPGKQMSIDSDLNAGLIDESEARARRKQLALEAEFYGAMDGASRFTQRDAVASILITFINIVAGFLIGVLQHGMDLAGALKTYTVLTIGDGLVTVVPALMISISGGLIVTRASSDARLGADFRGQVLGNAQPLMLAGGVLSALALFPGLPTFSFLALGAGVIYSGWRLRRKAPSPAVAAAAAAPALERENLESLMKVDLLAVEVGLGLVKIVEGGAGSPLLRRISGIRRQLASDLGYLLPPVRVTDNLSMNAGEYAVMLKGVEVDRYEIRQGCDMAIHTRQGVAAPPEGIATREPAFKLPAWWIPSHTAEAARSAGFTVVDPVSVLGTHLAELIRRHAHEMFSRQDAKKFLDRVAEDNPKVVEDLVPKLIPLAAVQRVLQNLMRERVSIRDGGSILEALSEAAAISRNPILLTEYVRQSIRRAVVRPYLSAAGELAVYVVDPQIERAIEGAIEHGELTSQMNLAPQKLRELVDKIKAAVDSRTAPAVLLTGAGSRYFLKQAADSALDNAAVIAHNEIPDGVKVVSLGVIQ
jgi:flagellar biosynthesis protein FlhA